jgi:DNA-binding HxlR family transcriptional regulator
MARSVLTARPRKLTENGILDRHAYSEHPPRIEYELTEKSPRPTPTASQAPEAGSLSQTGAVWCPRERRA